MSLRFIDSFDGFGHIDGKYTTWFGTNLLDAAYGRNGKGLRVNANTIECARFSIPSTDFAVWGGAIQLGLGSIADNIAFREGSTSHISLRFVIATGIIEIRRGVTLIGTSPIDSMVINTWHYIEAKVVIHDTAGSVELRVDNTTRLTLTGIDTRNGGTGLLDNIAMGGVNGHPINIDDIYALDDAGPAPHNDFLGDCVVENLNPNGNGNYAAWDGSDGDQIDNYLMVDENDPPDDDTTYVSSGVATDKDTYTVEDLVTTDADVLGVQMGIQARHEGAGGTIRAMLRRGGSDQFGSALTPAAGYTYQRELWELDPVAAAAWTIANFNATEFGEELVS